jgi:hypothetical protein
MKNIPYQEITEGNLQAVKDTGDFGGPNKWRLRIKTNNGWFEDVQWMEVYKIQQFFNTKLPVYEEVGSIKYELKR